MSRKAKHNNARFLEAKPTQKPMASLARRKRLKDLQKKARQTQRRARA